MRSCRVVELDAPSTIRTLVAGRSWRPGQLETVPLAKASLAKLLEGQSPSSAVNQERPDEPVMFECTLALEPKGLVTYTVFMDSGGVTSEELYTERRGQRRYLLRRIPEQFLSHASLGQITEPQPGLAWLGTLSSGAEALEYRGMLLDALALPLAAPVAQLDVPAQAHIKHQIEDTLLNYGLVSEVGYHLGQSPSIRQVQVRGDSPPEIWAEHETAGQRTWQRLELQGDWH